jgi:Cys-rich protein (TIGR01571 family)
MATLGATAFTNIWSAFRLLEVPSSFCNLLQLPQVLTDPYSIMHTDERSLWRTETVTTTPRPFPYVDHADPAYNLNIVRADAWQIGLFGCFSSFSNCSIVTCLPCVSLAQISQRIRWAKYWHVLVVLLGLFFVELVVSQFVLEAPSFHRYWFDYRAYSYDVYRATRTPWSSSRLWTWPTLSNLWSCAWETFSPWHRDDLKAPFMAGAVAGAVLGFCTFFGTLTGLVLIFVTWTLRLRVRTLFNIPGSCFGDCLASCCCSCCAVAQMATHVKSYKKGSCNFGPVDTLPAFLPQ